MHNKALGECQGQQPTLKQTCISIHTKYYTLIHIITANVLDFFQKCQWHLPRNPWKYQKPSNLAMSNRVKKEFMGLCDPDFPQNWRSSSLANDPSHHQASCSCSFCVSYWETDNLKSSHNLFGGSNKEMFCSIYNLLGWCPFTTKQLQNITLDHDKIKITSYY